MRCSSSSRNNNNGCEWEIGTAGRKGWMDRVECEASRRSARGRGCHHRKVKMFDLGCAWDCVPSVCRATDDGGGEGEELAVMMMLLLLLLRWLAACCLWLTAGRGKIRKNNKNSIWIFAQRTAEQECWL